MKRLLLLFLLAPVMAMAQVILPGAPVVLSAITGASAPPSGAAGGVLGGTYPNPGFGSFTSATLKTAISDATGTGAALFQNGALGTPISGTVTNLTGTASININGTVGASTPDTGNFTTLTSTTMFFGSGGTGSTPAIISGNGGSGANGGVVYRGRVNSVDKFSIATEAAIFGGTGTTLSIVSNSDSIKLYPNSALGATFSSTGLAVTGVVTTTGKYSNYNSVATTGWGVPAIYGAGRVTAQSAANASISTYTVGAADGSFEVSANMNVTVSTTLVTTLTCTYTDESNTSRTMIFPVQQLTGSFIAAGAITGLGAWETPTMHIRCKASTAITIGTTAGTFTGVTYTAEGIIKQMN